MRYKYVSNFCASHIELIQLNHTLSATGPTKSTAMTHLLLITCYAKLYRCLPIGVADVAYFVLVQSSYVLHI